MNHVSISVLEGEYLENKQKALKAQDIIPTCPAIKMVANSSREMTNQTETLYHIPVSGLHLPSKGP